MYFQIYFHNLNVCSFFILVYTASFAWLSFFGAGRAVGRSEYPGGQEVIVVGIICSLVQLVITVLPKPGGRDCSRDG